MFLTHGTGMGCGIIANGELYSGANDMAGEVGHIRLSDFGPVGFGKAGSFEGFCSGGGIARLAQMKALEQFQMGQRVSFCESPERLNEITAKTVADAAMAGDKLAVEVFRISGEYLGKALSLFIDILNPELIILGSIFFKCNSLLTGPMTEVINRETHPISRQSCKIVECGLGEKINEYEAVSIAVYEWKKRKLRS
jgi:glucokinase